MHDPSLNQLNIKYKKKRNNNQDDNNEDMKENLASFQPKKQYQNSCKQNERGFPKKTNFIHEHKQGGNRK